MWNPYATTFVNASIVGQDSFGVFVDPNNTVYVAAKNESRIHVLNEGNSTPTRTIFINGSHSYSLFVTDTGDIYAGVSDTRRVDKWTLTAINGTPVMNASGYCFGLFVDTNSTVYCSSHNEHKVIAKSAGNASVNTSIIAGTGCPGSATDMLFYPYGIFVDTDFNLYVADSGNHRIQFFAKNNRNAVTKAGTGASNTIALNWPSGIILDASGSLFILDSHNHRIVASGLGGFRCVVGCSFASGSAANQLSYPSSLSFDRSGNMYVLDRNNDRLQKFLLATNTCGEYETSLAVGVGLSKE